MTSTERACWLRRYCIVLLLLRTYLVLVWVRMALDMPAGMDGLAALLPALVGIKRVKPLYYMYTDNSHEMKMHTKHLFDYLYTKEY